MGNDNTEPIRPLEIEFPGWKSPLDRKYYTMDGITPLSVGCTTYRKILCEGHVKLTEEEILWLAKDYRKYKTWYRGLVDKLHELALSARNINL